MPKPRVLSVGYAKDACVSNYDLNRVYNIISAKDGEIEPKPELLTSGIDIGLMCLHISNAPERRKLLGLIEDKTYEIMVSFSPVHIHTQPEIQGGAENRQILKATYAKFFNIEKDSSAGGFTYKKMFVNLMPKRSLSLDVRLTEIDNRKVDPDALEVLLDDTSIGTVLDLSPINPKDYIMLASNVVNKIQEVFGSDNAVDDPLWDDTLVMEANPSIPGSYRLTDGIYAIVEGEEQTDFSKIAYYKNGLVQRQSTNGKSCYKSYDANYLVFSVGASS